MSDATPARAKRPRRRLTIHQQLLLALLGVNALVMFLIGAYLYDEQKEVLFRDIDARLSSVAILAREMLPSDYHDRITGPDSVSDAEFQKIVDRNNQLCKKLGLEYLWSLLLVDGKIVFTSSTSPDKVAANRKHAMFFEPHSNPELYTNTFATMRATYKANVDKWGDIRVALVPFRDAQGRKYLFGASVHTAEVERQLGGVVREVFAVGFIGFLLSTAASLWVARRVTRPISRLTDTIRAISTGRTDLKADETGSVEMVLLARHFNLMNRFLQNRITDLEVSRSQLVTRHDTELRHAEGSLKVSEQRYRSLLNFAVDGIMVGKPDGEITEANERMCELFGLARSEIVGKHISEMPFTPECLKAVPFRFDLLEKGEKVVTARTIRRKDGSEVSIEMHSKRMPDGTLQSIYRDITARKKTEAALSEVRRLLEDTQRIAQMGGWEIDLMSGKAAWTDEIYRIYGVGRDFDINDVEKVLSFYDAESRLLLDRARTEGFARGEPFDLECRFIRANGERIWVRVMGQPTLVDGQVVKDAGILMDITRRKQTEEALENARHLLNEAQEIAKLGAWRYEVGSGHVIWTDEVYRIHGVGVDFDTNNLERDIGFYAPEHRPILKQALSQAVEAGEPFDLELEIIGATGERIWVRVSGRADVENGKTVSVSGCFMDINVRKRAELALQKSEQRYKNLLNFAVDGILVCDNEGFICDANECLCCICGLTQDELIGRNFIDLPFTPESLERSPIRGDLVQKGELVVSERVIRRRDGSEVVVEMRSKKMPDGFNQSIWNDITRRKREEAALQETRRMLEEAQRLAKLGAWKYEISTRQLTWTDEVYRIHGIGREYPINRLADDISFAAPEYDAALKEAFRGAVERGVPYDLELEIIRADGQRVWVLASGRPNFEGEKIIRVDGHLMDITESKQAADRLLRSRQELSRQNEVLNALLQNLSVGIVMVDAESAVPLVANYAALQLMGFSDVPDGDLHRHLTAYSFFTGPERKRLPLEQLPVVRALRGERVQGEEVTVVRPDGSELTLEIFATPVKNEEGKPWASLASFVDISARKRAEIAMQESETRYRQLFEMESDALLLTDFESSRFLDVNLAAQTLYGYSRDEMLAIGPEDVVDKPEQARTIIQNCASAKTGIVRVDELLHKKKDGSAFPVEITARFYTMSGRLVFVSAIRDVTERKRARELLESWNASLEKRVAERTEEVEKYAHQLQSLTGQLVRAEEAERQRITDVLHEDLQQILVATRMTLEAARQSVKAPPVRKPLDAVDDMLARSIRLTRSLVHEIEVPGVREGEISFAVDWLRLQVQEKFSLSVDLEMAEGIKPVSENVYLCLYRAVQELLFNVVKHARVSRVVIEVRPAIGGKGVQIVVRDEGCGFATNTSVLAEKTNKGFGLFSIRERLEGLGGHMEIQSEVGRGTTVILTAPIGG